MSGTAKKNVLAVFPDAKAKRYQDNSGGHFLIWNNHVQEMILGAGSTEDQAWRAALLTTRMWKKLQRDVDQQEKLIKRAVSLTLRMEKDLIECGWIKEDCGHWSDPIDGNHVPLAEAHKIATQRLRHAHKASKKVVAEVQERRRTGRPPQCPRCVSLRVQQVGLRRWSCTSCGKRWSIKKAKSL